MNTTTDIERAETEFEAFFTAREPRHSDVGTIDSSKSSEDSDTCKLHMIGLAVRAYDNLAQCCGCGQCKLGEVKRIVK